MPNDVNYEQQFIRAIYNGKMDRYLDQIIDAIKHRRSTQARAKLVSISIGDKVRFTSEIRPAYLRGLTAVAKKVNGASIVVDFGVDPAFGRFAGAHNVRVPARLVERI